MSWYLLNVMSWYVEFYLLNVMSWYVEFPFFLSFVKSATTAILPIIFFVLFLLTRDLEHGFRLIFAATAYPRATGSDVEARMLWSFVRFAVIRQLRNSTISEPKETAQNNSPWVPTWITALTMLQLTHHQATLRSLQILWSTSFWGYHQHGRSSHPRPMQDAGRETT